MADGARRLNVDDLLPADTILTIGGQEFPVRGDLPVPAMLQMLRLEQAIDAAGDDTALLADAFEQSYTTVMNLIRSKTPDAPDLALSVEQLLSVMTFLANPTGEEDSVKATVSETLRDETRPEPATAAESGAEGEASTAGADDPPTAAAAA